MGKLISGIFAALSILCMLFAKGSAAQSPSGITIRGAVSAPAPDAAASALSSVPGAAIKVYSLDALGNKTGETIAASTADENGAFSLDLPPGATLPAPGLVVVSGEGDNSMRAFITGEIVDVNLFSEHAVHNLLHEGRGLDKITAADMGYYEYMGAREYELLENVSGDMSVSEIMAVLNPVSLKRIKCRGSAELNVEYIRAAAESRKSAACRFCCLAGVDLGGMDLNKADLSGADMNNADLSRAKLFGANLQGATLNRASLHRAALSRADLGGASLRGAYMRGAFMNRANLSAADLRGANLYESELEDATLIHADLRGASLENANLEYSDLMAADLRDALLNYSNLTDANLIGAELFGADFSGATWTDGATCGQGSIGLCD
jgi:uncharacterized protein YjbI with pentapeptide repeats